MHSASEASLSESLRYAEDVTRRSGSSFRLSFLLLPQEQYRAMCVLYAYMRLTDDLSDSPASEKPCDREINSKTLSTQKLSQLLEWRSQTLDCINSGKFQHPLHPALHNICKDYQISPEWLTSVIDGAEFDQSPQSIQTYADLQKYCYLVAGTVGLCCQAIWRADLSQTRELAITCGEAFQLTNILRDIKEDSEIGRCYLPTEELTQHGISLEQLPSSQPNAAFLELMQFQIQRAKACYQTASNLDKHLQGAGRRMFRVMFSTYRQLLEKIAADPGQVLSKRIKLSKGQRIQTLLTAPFSRAKAHF